MHQVSRGMRVAAWLSLLSMLQSGDLAAQREPLFFDVTAEAGLARVWDSYAIAAADYDRDGDFDLAVSNHGYVSLHRNRGDGTFVLVEDSEVSLPRIDTHGVSWLDFDSDGWLDLFVSCGGQRGLGAGNANRLLLSEDGKGFVAAELPELLAYPRSGARSVTAAFIGENPDLTLFLMGYKRPGRGQRVLTRANGAWIDRTAAYKWDDVHATAVRELRLSPDATPLYFTQYIGVDAGQAYSLAGAAGMKPVSRELCVKPHYFVSSVVPVDFDADGDEDLYYVLGPTALTGPPEVRERTLYQVFRKTKGKLSQVLVFDIEGEFALEVILNIQLRTQDVLLGAGRATTGGTILRIHPTDKRLAGKPDLNEVTGVQMFLWRNDDEHLVFSHVCEHEDLFAADTFIKITGVDAPPRIIRGEKSKRPGPSVNRLYKNMGGRFVEVAEQLGVDDPGFGTDAVVGDFNNDGYLDLYVLNGADLYENRPNSLFLNEHGTSFSNIAPGTLLEGPRVGRSDHGVAMDYDLDGDLDLFFVNGYGLAPVSREGPWVLLKNTLAPGNWVCVDLRGRPPNTSAFGATVTLEAGELKVVQQRTSLGSRYGGSVLPLHFGLGEHTQGTIVVRWPSGEDTRQGVSAGETVTVSEALVD